MKLSRLRLAKLINQISILSQTDLSEYEIEKIDDLIDIEIEIPSRPLVSEEAVNELLHQIGKPDGFISAIKAYRVLTNAGLKEAKEAIEKYRFGFKAA